MDQRLREEVAQLHAQICSGLADSNRILLLYVLAEQPRNVTDLSHRLGLPQPTVSRHLKILRERGIVVAEREGQSVFYSLADERIIHALDLLREILAVQLQNQGTLAATVTERPTI